MNRAFIPYGDYEEIVNLLGQWKILDMKTIYKMLQEKIHYANLSKKILKLEKEGLVKSIFVGRRQKHLFLSNKGLEFTPFDSSYEIAQENLNHDLTVAKVLKTFLSYPNFKAGKMFHQIVEDHIYPDALVEGEKNGNKFQLAIEVELTQKEQNRVKQKYIKYAKSNYFDYAIFITHTEALYDAYIKYLREMNREIQSAIILMHDRYLTPYREEFKQALCFYQGKKINFVKMFGV
jgi:hypothetical protein